LYSLKTTIELPEVLYRKAKIRAVETGQMLRQIVLTSLKNELETRIEEPSAPHWANRKLRSAFKRLLEGGSLSGGTDFTEIISEDRSARDETIAQ
jgi:phage gpG-like protein